MRIGHPTSLGLRAIAGIVTAVVLAAAAAPAAGQSFGRAASFDLDDQVTCAGNFDTGVLSIEAWIFVRGYGPDGYGGIVAWGREQDSSYELGVLGLNGVPQILLTLNLGKAGYTAIVKSGLYQLNTWTHIAVTYDGHFVNFFSNGVFIDSEPASVPIQPGGQGAVFVIGNLFTGNDQHADLSIDDVRIWNIVRSEDEIHCAMSRSLASPEPGLFAYYTFDEASGQTVTDFSGNGRTGVLGLTSAPETSDPTRVLSTVPVRCFDVFRQPSSYTQCRGGTVVLNYGVCSLEPLHYQWRRNTQDIEGANQSTYTITGLDESKQGDYDVVVTSPCGTVTSIPANVTLCAADFDCSGFVDLDDFSTFVTAFEIGGDNADFDGSGFVDLDDFTAFVHAFETGC